MLRNCTVEVLALRSIIPLGSSSITLSPSPLVTHICFPIYIRHFFEDVKEKQTSTRTKATRRRSGFSLMVHGRQIYILIENMKTRPGPCRKISYNSGIYCVCFLLYKKYRRYVYLLYFKYLISLSYSEKE